jgi:CRP-like cAMP-binding protein
MNDAPRLAGTGAPEEVRNSEADYLMRGDDAAANPALSEEEIASLGARGTERRLRDTEVLYQPGELLDVFYVVLEGEIWIEDGRGDDLRVVSRQRRGNFLGEHGLLTGGPAYMTNAAHGDTTLLCVPVPELLEVVAHQPVLSETIMRASCCGARCSSANAWVCASSVRPPRARRGG